MIDNEYQDEPLLAALKQKPFELTDLDLANLRLLDNRGDVSFHSLFRKAQTMDTLLGEKCRAVQAQLEKWRLRVELIPLPDFLWELYRETGYYAWCGTQPGGDLKQANLRMLADKAAEWEKYGRSGLRGFVRQMKDESSTGSDTGARVLSVQDDLVRIMTMHKSKGLEFPVVFLMRTTTALRKVSRDIARTHPILGVSLPFSDPETGAEVPDTLLKAVFAERKRLEELAESCRLLYVAMTRPKERLIITGCVPGCDSALWHMPRGDVRVSEAKSMLDWIMQGVMDEDDRPVTEKPLDRGLWLTVEEPGDELPEDKPVEARVDGALLTDKLMDAPLPEKFLWWNEPAPEPAPPPKASVTTWVKKQRPLLLTEEQEEETPEVKRREP